jgi:hypothetical protein
MRALSIATLLVSAFATGTAGAAAPQATDQLRSALAAMVAPPGQSSRPADPDQGDDHASATAIAVVCSKDTPAAQRSAICPTPISPD